MSFEKLCLAGLMLCLQVLFSPPAEAQLSEAAKSAVLIGSYYEVLSNITYAVADNYELKLDVFLPTTSKTPTPV